MGTTAKAVRRLQARNGESSCTVVTVGRRARGRVDKPPLHVTLRVFIEDKTG